MSTEQSVSNELKSGKSITVVHDSRSTANWVLEFVSHVEKYMGDVPFTYQRYTGGNGRIHIKFTP